MAVTDSVSEEGSEPKSGTPIEISWQGSPWSLTGLSFINFLLTILTLGIYSFWGKTEVRRRMWSMIRVNGEPLEYTGTGLELFLGFLIIFFVFLLPTSLWILFLQLYLSPVDPLYAPLLIGSIVALYLVVPLLIGMAIYRAVRYRASRTRWRGIRAALTGNSIGFGWAYYWTLIVDLMVLGWLSPWRSMMLQRRLTGEMQFGDEPLRFTAKADGLYGRFAALWFGTIGLYIALIAAIFGVIALAAGLGWIDPNALQPKPDALGQPQFDVNQLLMLYALMAAPIILFLIGFLFLNAFYQVKLVNHFAGHTFIDNAKFHANFKTGSFSWLMVSNFLLLLFTIGILSPVINARSARYFTERLGLEGTVDVEKIAQSQQELSKTGEGLASAFDVDAF